MEFTAAIDVTSYLSSRTGVGVCVGELVKALLAGSGQRRFRLCAVSARKGAREKLRRGFPVGDGEIRVVRVPVRCLASIVDRIPRVKVEALFGDADVYHASPFLVPASRRTALVVSVFDLTPIRFPDFHLPSNLFTVGQLRRRLERADLVIVPSVSTERDLLELELVSPGKVRVIPLAVDAGFRTVEQSRAALPEGLGLKGEYILNVGTLEPRKNLPRLFQALRILKDRHRIPHKLVVAGPRGWHDREIYEGVERLNLTDSVIFAGYVSGEVLNLLYNHAHLLVYPSLYEGFGLPPLEAMAAGCPVAVSRISSLPEVVGDAGLYFDPLEVEEIAGAIYRILDSAELRARLIQSGKNRSLHFSWQETAIATWQVYREASAIRNTVRRGP